MIDTTSGLERIRKEDSTMKRMRRRKGLTKNTKNMKMNMIMNDNSIAFLVGFKTHLQNRGMLS